MMPNHRNFFLGDLRASRSLGFPKDVPRDREALPLLPREVLGDQLA